MKVEIIEKPGSGDELDYCVTLEGKSVALFRSLEDAILFARQYSKVVARPKEKTKPAPSQVSQVNADRAN